MIGGAKSVAALLLVITIARTVRHLYNRPHCDHCHRRRPLIHHRHGHTCGKCIKKGAA